MIRRRWPVLGLFAIAAGLSVADHLGAFGRLGPDRQRYDRAVATISHVVDGDTYDIDMPDGGAATTRVRLLGIDCPEIARAPGANDAHFGREAANWASAELSGKRVRIVLDPTRPVRDKHGRLLVYLFDASARESDAASINQLLIDLGLAYADWRFEHVHELRFERAERIASRAKVGLWRTVKREQMPEWRQKLAPEYERGNRRN